MVDVSKILSKFSSEKLKNYVGGNDYILSLQQKMKLNPYMILTKNQLDYLDKNIKKEPEIINKVVEITEYFGEELKKQFELKNTPKKIQVFKLLSENDKSYHVTGKLYKNQKEYVLFYIPKTQILDTLEPNDNYDDIEVDFESVNKINKLGRKLFKHQEEGVKFLLSKDRSLLADDMGLGKASSIDSKLLTPKGWIKMGDVKVGDLVIGSNGKPTKVTGVFPQGKKDLYNITFTDGTIVETCDEHLWAVQTTNHKKRNNGFEVKELKDIKGDLTYGTRGNLKWYIPMVKPVEFNKQDIHIHPYLLGLLLGDGCLTQKNISYSTVDNEILQSFIQYLPEYHIIKHTRGCNYFLTCNIPNKQKGFNNEIRKWLIYYGLIGTKSDTKFIPKNYIYNNKEIRVSILQGLLDTDGYCSKSGTITYTSTSKQLSDDVKEIIHSLGGVARQQQKKGGYKKNGVLIECKTYYSLTINLPEDITPFRLSRKINRMVKNKKYHPSRGIKKIEYSRTFDSQCISVESKDRLYVMDDYVVTHNTKSTISASLLSGSEKILIICPANAKINWYREVTEYVDVEFVTIVKPGFWQPKMFTIVNYDILDRFHNPDDETVESYINNEQFDLLICDEAQMLKNKDAKRSKIVKQISNNIQKVWLLTGTPINNRPMDFYNLLSICKVPIVDNFQHFAYRYCDAKKFKKKLKSGQTKTIWLTDGASNLEELNRKVKPYMLRRLKNDHLDLPPKIVSPFYLELENRKEYDECFNTYLEWLKLEGKKLGSGRQMVEMLVLRRFISHIKIPYTLEMINNFLEQSDDRKIIIFTVFTETLDELKRQLGPVAVCHNGKLSSAEKQKSIDRFQTDPNVRVFIGNIISAGSAITLTASDTTIFHDLDFVPSNHAQAEDRNYRISQTNTVNIYYPIFQDTIEEKIYEILQKKKEIISKVVGDEFDTTDIMTDFMNFIGEYETRKFKF